MKVEIEKSEVMKDMSCSTVVSVNGDLKSVFAVLKELGLSSTSGKECHHHSQDSENKYESGCSKCGIDLKRAMMYSCPEGNCPSKLG